MTATPITVPRVTPRKAVLGPGLAALDVPYACCVIVVPDMLGGAAAVAVKLVLNGLAIGYSLDLW